jgi:hypothetical protein
LASDTSRKKVILFDPAESTSLLADLLERMNFEVQSHADAAGLAELAGDSTADLLILNLSLLGESYKEVTARLGELDLGTGDAPPAIALTDLLLTEEACARLETYGLNAVLPSQAPLMELIFTVNRLLFPRMHELRRYTRVFGGFPVQFRYEKEWRDGEIYNISQQGAFIQCQNPPPENTRLQVQFLLPGRESPLKASAFVNWVNSPIERNDILSPSGVGISFLTLNQEDITSLDLFVSHRQPG